MAILRRFRRPQRVSSQAVITLVSRQSGDDTSYTVHFLIDRSILATPHGPSEVQRWLRKERDAYVRSLGVDPTGEVWYETYFLGEREGVEHGTPFPLVE
jgi:hypothetical protein